MSLFETDNYSRGWEDVVFPCLMGPMFVQQVLCCTMNEFNAYRFRFISRGHTALAVAAFYPGLCYATQHLYRWADGVYKRQVRLSQKANRDKLLNNPFLKGEMREKKLAAAPKSPRELGYMNPTFAPFVLAALALNLRAWQLDRSLALYYRFWSPDTRVGVNVFKNLRGAITSTPIIGIVAILASRTLKEYKKEANKHQERTF